MTVETLPLSLPSTERILLGPGPSLISPRVMRAMAAPVLSHLDPDFMLLLDDTRHLLGRVMRADGSALTIATSGTGTSAMEAAVANTVSDGMKAVVVVSGYFGDRLAQIIERYGATVRRIDVEWGRAIDPARLADELKREGADIVGVVHAETSTGVLNPVQELAAIARAHGALTIVDAVTSLGGHELDLAGWGIDVAYSCSQKCIGAPSGMSPIAVSGPARARLVKCRSFYLDLKLLEDYWVSRKYHHTLSSTMIYALREALLMVEEEGSGGPSRAAPQAPPRVRRRDRGDEPVAAAAARRTSVDAECRPRALRRGRGGRAQDAPHRLQHGSGCRTRPAGGEGLAHWPDGRQFLAANRAAVPGGAGGGAGGQRLPSSAGGGGGGGAGGAANIGESRT